MREHQIVITLKPEQFLEVQRLARAAKAKSMGIYVRQQLLAALGIEGAASKGAANQADVEPILTELNRLHSELKQFVAESLTAYLPESESSAEPFTSLEAEPAYEASVESDQLEEIADRTFAISPRLGPVEPAAQKLGSAESYLEDYAEPIKTLAATPSSDPILPIHGYMDEPVGSVEPAPDPFAFTDSYESGSEYGEVENVYLDANGYPMARFEDNADGQQDAPADEDVRDPLMELLAGQEDLLNTPAIEADEEDDEMEHFEIPLSIAERARNFEEEEEQSVLQDLPAAQAAGSSSTFVGQHHTRTAGSWDTVGEEDTSILSGPVADQVDEDSTGTGPSPLSGGPPPKRRRV